MSKMLRRPPARFDTWERQPGLSGRQTFGAVDSDLAPGLRRGDGLTIMEAATITTPYIQQINPRPEQPKLIFNSAAQPFTVWGWRRFNRTHMTAGPRFQGRWAAVGVIIRSYADRGRMTGVATRQGSTYVYPRFRVTPGPRAIVLGGIREK